MAGRRSKYTPETVDKITQAIRLGATYKLACDYAGISEDTFARWQARYADFADTITQAEGEAAIKWLALIEKHAVDLPQWAAWKLERRYPQMYGKQAVEVTGANGGPLRIKAFVGVSPDDWDEDGADGGTGG